MRYALGIDGGGSTCDVVAIDEQGTVVGCGQGGPTHASYTEPEVIVSSCRRAIEQAIEGLHDAELYVADAPGHQVIAEIASDLPHVQQAMPVTEADVAYVTALQERGMIVHAGTGSFIHLRTSDERDRHAGGLGPVLGDYGSAYDIGLGGLRAAFAPAWIESRRTSLARKIPHALGCENLRQVFQLVCNGQGISRREMASLARVVNSEAEAGDAVAARCIERAADELAGLAIDVIRAMGVEDEHFPVIASGSVAQQCHRWWRRVYERIAEVAPDVRPVIPRVRPVIGAAMIALRAIGVASSEQLIDRIVATQGPFLEALEQEADCTDNAE